MVGTCLRTEAAVHQPAQSQTFKSLAVAEKYFLPSSFSSSFLFQQWGRSKLELFQMRRHSGMQLGTKTEERGGWNRAKQLGL